MPYDYKGSTDLIWQPDARVQTFPSGLLLAQRSAVIRKDLAASARAELGIGFPLPGDYPAIDGVFIYPAPQESESGGFVTFSVSAYGRTTTQFRETETSEIITDQIGKTFQAPRVRREYVIRTAQAQSPFTPPTRPLQVRNRWGHVITLPGYFWRLQAFEQMDYGAFTETIESWGIRLT